MFQWWAHKLSTNRDPLQWCHNERDGVSNQRRLYYLLNCLFRRRSKKTSELRVTGLCAGNSSVTGEFPGQRVSDGEMVSIWWRHHTHCSFGLLVQRFELYCHGHVFSVGLVIWFSGKLGFVLKKKLQIISCSKIKNNSWGITLRLHSREFSLGNGLGPTEMKSSYKHILGLCCSFFNCLSSASSLSIMHLWLTEWYIV